jgi:hypothetical protein
MSVKSSRRIAVLFCLPVLWLGAEPKAKSGRHVRILAVGDSPPFRQEIRDGVRYELEVSPGSIPPREVLAGFGKQAAAAVALRLGHISMPVSVPPGEGIVDLRRVDETPDAMPWLRIQRPEAGDFLVLLWRNPAKKSWQDAMSLIVPDGSVAAPVGHVRIVNLYPQAIRMTWGVQSLILPAAKMIQRAIKPGAEIPFQILVADSAGTMKTYYSGTVTQNQGERGLITIYRADGVAPRRPLQVAMLREPVSRDSPPPAAGNNR